jgi:hypothetical protein
MSRRSALRVVASTRSPACLPRIAAVRPTDVVPPRIRSVSPDFALKAVCSDPKAVWTILGHGPKHVPRQARAQFLHLSCGNQSIFGISPVELPTHAAHCGGHRVTRRETAIRRGHDLAHSLDPEDAGKFYIRRGPGG